MDKNLEKIVLLISSREGSDWSMDLLYGGLVQLLGPQRVLCYPPRKKYTGELVPNGKLLKVGDKEKDYGVERGSLGYTKNNGMVNQLDQWSVRQLMAKGDIGLVIVDERAESFKLYCEIYGPALDVPVVCVSGHDRFWNESPELVKEMYGRNFLLLFSDLFEPRFKDLPYFRPYDWSANFDHFWNPKKRLDLLTKKEYDICFMGYNSHPDRDKFVRHIETHWKGLKLNVMLERRKDTFDAFLDKSVYFEAIAKSRIALNLRGAAETGKTMRYWEIPYVGSFMLSQQFVMPGRVPFIEGSHCAYFSDILELDEKIDHYLNNEWMRESCAIDAHAHLMRSHTSEARAHEVMYQVRKALNENSLR